MVALQKSVALKIGNKSRCRSRFEGFPVPLKILKIRFSNSSKKCEDSRAPTTTSCPLVHTRRRGPCPAYNGRCRGRSPRPPGSSQGSSRGCRALLPLLRPPPTAKIQSGKKRTTGTPPLSPPVGPRDRSMILIVRQMSIVRPTPVQRRTERLQGVVRGRRSVMLVRRYRRIVIAGRQSSPRKI